MRNKTDRLARARAEVVSATAAAKGLGALIDTVRERGGAFVIERGGVPVAEIGPVSNRRCSVADLVAHLRTVSPHDDAFAREVRAGVRRVNKRVVPPDPWVS
jgi:hypothetical protein